jgi:hypothetical protein
VCNAQRRVGGSCGNGPAFLALRKRHGSTAAAGARELAQLRALVEAPAQQ